MPSSREIWNDPDPVSPTALNYRQQLSSAMNELYAALSLQNPHDMQQGPPPVPSPYESPWTVHPWHTSPQDRARAPEDFRLYRQYIQDHQNRIANDLARAYLHEYPLPTPQGPTPVPATLTPETTSPPGPGSLPSDLVNPSTPTPLSTLSDTQLDELATSIHSAINIPDPTAPLVPPGLIPSSSVTLQALVTNAGNLAIQVPNLNEASLTPQQRATAVSALYNTLNSLVVGAQAIMPTANSYHRDLNTFITANRTRPTPVSLRDIRDELQSLKSSRTFRIYLTRDSGKPAFIAITPPISIHSPDHGFPNDRLALGPFQLVFSLSEMVTNREANPRDWFYATALSPNYSLNRFVHPHVSGTNICLGSEAPAPMKLASREFRLLDMFTMLHSILREYNHHSPYCNIENWEPPVPAPIPAPRVIPRPTPPVPSTPMDPSLVAAWNDHTYYWSNPTPTHPFDTPSSPAPRTVAPTTIPAGSTLVVESVDPTTNSVTLRAEPPDPFPPNVSFHTTSSPSNPPLHYAYWLPGPNFDPLGAQGPERHVLSAGRWILHRDYDPRGLGSRADIYYTTLEALQAAVRRSTYPTIPAPAPTSQPLPPGVEIHQTTSVPSRFYATINRPGSTNRIEGLPYLRLARNPVPTPGHRWDTTSVTYYSTRERCHQDILSTPIPTPSSQPPSRPPQPTPSWDAVIEATRNSRPVPPPVSATPTSLRTGVVRTPSVIPPPPGAIPNVQVLPVSEPVGQALPAPLLNWLTARWLPESESLAILRELTDRQLQLLHRHRRADTWQSWDLRSVCHIRGLLTSPESGAPGYPIFGYPQPRSLISSQRNRPYHPIIGNNNRSIYQILGVPDPR